MSTLSWIVGRGGLLGSAIERAIGPGTWHPEYPFPWSDPSALRNSISHAVRGFQTSVTENLFDSWTIYWCAGSGVVGTSAEHLAAETTAFISFLINLGMPYRAFRMAKFFSPAAQEASTEAVRDGR